MGHKATCPASKLVSVRIIELVKAHDPHVELQLPRVLYLISGSPMIMYTLPTHAIFYLSYFNVRNVLQALGRGLNCFRSH